MKGVIILPTFVLKYGRLPYWYIFYEIRDQLGFELKYEDRVRVSSDTDVVIMVGMPHHNYPKIFPGFFDLDKKTKVVMFTLDIQCYTKECSENKLKVFERCDMIVCPSYAYFLQIYPQFSSKLAFLPNCFSPHERYARLSFNNNPSYRCLLSGAKPPKFYPLRAFVASHLDRQKIGKRIDVRGPTYVTRDDYAKMLNSYYCCITCGGIYSIMVAKHFEVPAVGSLLLAPQMEDMDRVGLIPNQHYIPVTRNNIFQQIQSCLSSPDRFNAIREEGMKFVRENHSLNNRVKTFKEILDKLMKNDGGSQNENSTVV